MRVTNQMVTSNSLRNMQKSMQRVSGLNQQITTGKKISAPSEDPVVAIRALKLRTTCDQLYQYKNKNIKDALSWLDTTQTSIQNIFDRLEDVYVYCEQGSTDTFNTTDRNTIINELLALRDHIYAEGGTTYAGRYLFSGYKTETNLIFQDVAAKQGLSYNITEDIDPKNIEVKNVVLNEIDPSKLDDILASGDYAQPESESVYRLKLAYDNLEADEFTISSGVDENGDPKPITFTDENGTTQTLTITVKSMSESATYYDVGPNDVNYIPETGELIFGTNVYNSIKTLDNFSVNYNKSEFKVGDLRPEMYFNCTQFKEQPNGDIVPTEFTISENGQPINYEVNFKQYVTVNAEGREVITHAMGNKIVDLANAVQDVLDIENTIAKLKELLNDPQYKDNEDAVAQINKMLEGADVELAMKRENMQKLFGNNMTNFQNFMEDVSAVQARVGTTYSKVQLIETRVCEQLDDFEDLKSVNEDIETEEVAIEMYQAELVYESALATTASVIQKTLLDYL